MGISEDQLIHNFILLKKIAIRNCYVVSCINFGPGEKYSDLRVNRKDGE